MNQKGFANIVLVVVIIILAGTAGYFLLKSTRSGQPVKMISSGDLVTPPPTLFPSPATTNLMENWRTFRISAYNGYEFKYPPDSALVTGYELENKILNASGYWGARGGNTEVAVLSSQSTFSVGRHGYIANLADCKKVTWPNDQTEELKTTKVINGITYYFGTYTGAAAGTQTRFDVYHVFGGSGGDGCFELVISVSPLNGSTEISDQILSTFRFID